MDTDSDVEKIYTKYKEFNDCTHCLFQALV